MIKLRYFLAVGVLIAGGYGIYQCTGSGVKSAIEKGDLSHAVELVDKGTPIATTSQLIDELIKVGQLDKVALVMDKTLDKEIRWHSFKHEEEKALYDKVYKAFIRAGRYDDAWNYHELSYPDPNNDDNARHYYAYLVDVITDMAKKKKLNRANQFIKEHILWFEKYVDTSHSNSLKAEYSTNVVRAKLNRVIAGLSQSSSRASKPQRKAQTIAPQDSLAQ